MPVLKFNELTERTAPFLFKNFDVAGRRRLWLKLATLLDNGVPMLQAIGSIKQLKIDTGQKDNPATVALNTWEMAIMDGRRLSAALDGWATDEEIMLIAAGEESKTMIESLRSTADIMVAKAKITAALKLGMAYPTVLVVVIFLALYMFGFKVVPAFTQSMHSDQWHGMALFMIETGRFVRSWLWLIVILFISAIILFFVSLPRFDAAIRIKLDRYAPYSIYRVIHGFSFLTATAALVAAGVKNISAIEKISEGAKPWLKTRLDACLAEMRGGVDMGKALANTGYEFPDLEVINDLGVYATVGGFDKALAITAREWLDAAVQSIEAKMKVVFGLSLMVLASIIATMVSGMISMQIQFSELFQQSLR